MLKYITLAIVELFGGLIGLSKKQAVRRGKTLKKVKDRDGVYEILSKVQFKVGEIIGLEDPDKVTLSKVELTPESQDIVDAREKERIEALAEKRAQEILAEKAMEDIVAAAGHAINQGQVTATGAPEVKAMEEILGYDITAKERDRAWETIQKEQEGNV